MASLARLANVRPLLTVAGKYRNFLMFGAPQSFMGALTGGMPTVLMAATYGPAEAGFFWLAYRVFGLPNQIVAESLRGALFQTMAAQRREGISLRRDILRSGGFCGAACLPFSLPLLLAGPALFKFVFGAAWLTAGLYAQITALGWLMQTASIPASVALVIHERQGPYFFLEAVATAARMAAFVVIAHNPALAVAIYTLVGAVHAAVVTGYAWFRTG
jgi:O-antigen/teichoic acid export membrane protein